MSLNVAYPNDPFNKNKGLLIFHQNKDKLPLVSLINQKNFKLTTKKKGKVLNKPVYSGFNKNTLSSIPRDIEIILLDKSKEEIFESNQNILNSIETRSQNLYEKKSNQTVNDNSRLTSFISKTLDDKKNHPATTIQTLSKKNQTKKEKENIVATKDYWKFYKRKEQNKKIIPSDKNHLNIHLYQSQFYPGPSDYSSEKSFDMINQQNKYRYKSLFKSESSHSLKTTKEFLPGPGSYIQMKSFLNNNNKHLSINLATKEKRFKNLFSSASLSPWFYSSSNKSNINEINKSQNNLTLLNKGDLYDFKRYILKEETDDRGKIKQFYIEDKSPRKKEEPHNEINNIKNKKNTKNKETNKINEYKLDKMLKKYINVRNAEKEYEVPGPGQYNIYMGFDKISKDKALEKMQLFHKPENLIPEEVLKNYSQNKNQSTNFTYFNEGNDVNKTKELFGIKNSKSSEDIFYSYENRKNSNGTLPFISKQKRIKFQDIILSKHTPGPCYYYNEEPH